MAVRLTPFLLLCLFAAAAGGQSATPSPGYYRVTGVPESDVLNVRAAPGMSGRRVGVLAPGAAPVEVVEVRAPRGTPWGLIAMGEGAGWVSMRYLEPIEVEGVAGTEVPAEARCGGTEPFWGLTFDGDAAVLDEPFLDLDPQVTRLPIAAAGPAAGRFQPILLAFAGGGGYALLERGVCSDGMSDIPHGWTLHLILGAEAARAAPRLLSGCCRVLIEMPESVEP